MRVRIIRNVLSGAYETKDINAPTVGDLRMAIGGHDAQFFREGKPLKDSDELEEKDFIIARYVPEAMTTLTVIGIVVGVAALVVGGIALAQAMKGVPDIGSTQTSPSLRGSSNTTRANSHLPLLLGHFRVYPDNAALAYTRYQDNLQYLRQLFCFGYKDVAVDLSTLKIDEMLFSSYEGATAALGLSLYPARVIESTVNAKLRNTGTATALTRTTASNTKTFRVGLSAPSGLFRYDDDKRVAVSIGIKIEWKPTSGDSWTTLANETLSLDTDVWRKEYSGTPSGDGGNGQYDVRVTRTNTESDSAYASDSVYWDVLRCDVTDSSGATTPVPTASRYTLLGIDLKATNQMNGTVGSLNAEATLVCRAYSGDGTGPEAWTVQETRNPASAILYLLTDPLANPRPLTDDQIVWADFEDFYTFCEEKGFECNAWISSDYVISDLIGYIATSNLGQIRKAQGKIGILIDSAKPNVTQLFTPRNAWDFTETEDCEALTSVLKLKFVDADAGYVEIERYVSLDENGDAFLDEDTDSDDDVTEVTLFGCTDATQAAKIGKIRLLELQRRRRTFTWSCDIEGLLCAEGDVVLLEHDSFLIGVGEGRVKRIIKHEGLVSSLILDAAIPMASGVTYGCTIRSVDNFTESVGIVTNPGMQDKLDLLTPSTLDVDEGDIVAVGPLGKETIKVIITAIERDNDLSCKITAVDYCPEIYADGEIPEFDPGLTVLPQGDSVGAGIVVPKDTTVRTPGKTRSSYLGPLSEVPASSYEGDTFLYIGATTGSYTQYHYYVYTSGSWVETTDADTVMKGHADALKIAKQSGTLIFAAKAYYDYLYVSHLIVGPGTGVAGSGFRFRASSDVDDGNSVFDMMYGDKVIFKVAPSTGKVFLGQPNSEGTAPESGFMYDPSSDTLKSKNDKTVINADGTLHATDLYASGDFLANDTPFRPIAACNFGYSNSTLTTISKKNVASISRTAEGNYHVALQNPVKVKMHTSGSYHYIDLFVVANSADTWDNGFTNPILCQPNWLRNYIDGRLSTDGNYAILSYVDLYFIDNDSDNLTDPWTTQVFLFATETLS